jgi:uncharacterized repeat protein (TIGR01451 family)
MLVPKSLVVALAAAFALPAVAGPVDLVTKVLTEKRVAAGDGTTRVDLKATGHAVPGDKLVYQLAYRNIGTQPVKDFVLSNPLPQGVNYVAPADGSPAPELSVDGSTFGSLAALRVKGTDGALRPASTDDVKIVRWRLVQSLAPGAAGQVAFRAVLR